MKSEDYAYAFHAFYAYSTKKGLRTMKKRIWPGDPAERERRAQAIEITLTHPLNRAEARQHEDTVRNETTTIGEMPRGLDAIAYELVNIQQAVPDDFYNTFFVKTLEHLLRAMAAKDWEGIVNITWHLSYRIMEFYMDEHEPAAATRLKMENKDQVTATWDQACEAGAQEEAEALERGEKPRAARGAALRAIEESFPKPSPDRKTCSRRYSQWRKANPDRLPPGCLQ